MANLVTDQPGTDPGPIRASVAPRSSLDGDPTLIAGASASSPDGARLERLGPGHAVLVEPGRADRRAPAGSGHDTAASRAQTRPPAPTRTRILFGPARRDPVAGTTVREVVVDGWRLEVVLESDWRAGLRERATRDRAGAVRASGPVEVRAIIPGRIVAVMVVPGDSVGAGQHVLVLEAMKMQNELRAPRAGSVERVAVAVGQNVEVGDLLMVIT